MGIFMDTIEDGSEYYGQYVDQTTGTIVFLSSDLSTDMVQNIRCEYCNNMVDKNEMEKHILVHSKRKVYVVVNDRIIKDFIYLSTLPKKIEVRTVGDVTGRLIMTVNGKEESLTFDNSLSIEPKVKKRGGNTISIIVKYDNLIHQYSIYVNALPKFRQKEIDELAYRFLFLNISNGNTPEISTFKQAIIAENEFEQQYKDGLEEYCLGIMFEKANQKEYKHRYEQAFYKLCNISTNFAISISRILAFRMNNFSYLLDCTESSFFAPANKYFNNRSQERKSLRKKGSEIGVYLDEFTRIYMALLEANNNKSDVAIEDLMRSAESSNLVHDLNDVDKIRLFKARYYRDKKDFSQALEYYSQLKSNPDFRKEAEGFINGPTK